MSAWLVTQTDRFAAAISVSGSVDWHSQHTLSNIAYFNRLFLNADPYSVESRYFSQSPLLYAGRYPTPVLQIAGALDRCTPATQAIQHHKALVEHSIDSMVVVYLKEGHRVKSFPAYIDYCHRLLYWLQLYMPV
jgi:dipeptidyl aminopeptidase/acylaminoacyl peptidase